MQPETRTFNLFDKGSFLGTRVLGKELREEIEKRLQAGEDVILNFDKVSMISHSFGDELVGKLSEKIGLEKLRERVRFKNVSKGVAPILRFVISNRRQSPAVN